MKTIFNYLVVVMLGLGWVVGGFDAANAASKESESNGQTIYWYERDVKKYAWMDIIFLEVQSQHASATGSSTPFASDSPDPPYTARWTTAIH